MIEFSIPLPDVFCNCITGIDFQNKPQFCFPTWRWLFRKFQPCVCVARTVQYV